MKTAIVTGSSGNMGKAIVQELLNKGYRVIGTVMPNEVNPVDHNHFVRKELNLLDEQEVAAFINEAIAAYNSIDVAVLTVGGFASGAIADTRTADIMRQVELNFSTTYTMARPVLLQMKQQGFGRIFMTGSRPGLHAMYGSGMIAYSLGKSLLFRLADLMNEEVKGKNIVTSIVVPSTIDTPQNRKAMPDADPSNWVKPSEIAGIISYHCSDEATALRETVIKVYGNS